MGFGLLRPFDPMIKQLESVWYGYVLMTEFLAHFSNIIVAISMVYFDLRMLEGLCMGTEKTSEKLQDMTSLLGSHGLFQKCLRILFMYLYT